MEIQGEDGSMLILKVGTEAVFGRGAGFHTDDLTVSRRHVSFVLKSAAADGAEPSTRVPFEVLGRNPVWVRSRTSGKVRTFRRSETGEIYAGDRFCVSGQQPVWFTLKERDEVAEESISDCESGPESVDVSEIDPIKEFGFLVIGGEFNQYPKNRMRDIKQWEWFLEDTKKEVSDDDDDYDDDDGEGRKGRESRRTRKRKKENEDEDWSGDGEEDQEITVKARRGQGPASSTRSRKPKRDAKKSRTNQGKTKRGSVDPKEEEDDDDDDETLGGFIVSDEEAELEEEENSEEEEDYDEDENDEE